MLLEILILLVSLAALVYSADKLVDNIVLIAEHLQISKMVIGLTVVAIGTSLPEAAASAAGALQGVTGIALGNVIGSNICNVALILGVPGFLVGINCSTSVVKREGYIMLGITALIVAVLLLFGEIPRWMAAIFLLAFPAFIYMCFKKPSDPLEEKTEEVTTSEDVRGSEEVSGFNLPLICGFLVASIVGLLVSSHYLVGSTVFVARALSIPESVIALSLIALGTSLPELSVSLASARKREGDICIGNVFGSNISNILLVLGLAGSISPIVGGGGWLYFDLGMMLFCAGLMVYFLLDDRGIDRNRGIFLLCIYGLVMLRCVLAPAV